MREIHRAIFRDDHVASALVGRHHCNQVELASRVDPGYRELLVFGGPNVQRVSGWRVVEIIHTVAVSDHEFRTTKYSLPPGFVAKIKKAKTESGEELLWLEA